MIVVTGAAGFVGQHLVVALRAQNGAVRAVDDVSNSPFRSPPRAVESVDVRDLRPDDLDGVDTIMHLATRKSIPESFEDRSLINPNIEVDRHARDLVTEYPARRLILVSSCEVYRNALRSCVDGELADERSKETLLRSGVASVAS